MPNEVDLEKVEQALQVATGLSVDVLHHCEANDTLVAADLLEENGDAREARWARGDLHQLKRHIHPKLDSVDRPVCMVIYPPEPSGNLARPYDILGREVSVIVMDFVASDYQNAREHVAKIPINYLTYDFIDLTDIQLSEDLRQLFRYSIAESSIAFPLSDEGTHLEVAVADPQDLDLESKLEFATNRRIVLRRAALSQIVRAIRIHYRDDYEIAERDVRIVERFHD